MRGQAHQIDLHRLHVKHHLARGLRRVAVEHDAVPAAHLADRGDVLDDADLVVDRHDGHENRVGTDCGLKGLKVKQTVFLDVHVRDFIALGLKVAHGVEHGLVLGLHGDEVPSLVLVEVRGALDGEVVGLGSARGPDDFARIGVDVGRNLFPSLLDGLLGLPAVAVGAARRIAEPLAKEGDHLLGDARIHRSRCRVVKINGKFHF